ncbi:pathogenesis-related thaumatin-like protein 3.5 [Arachis stenosperma]|uniref:pathogenesis-related thaumatin-like protein 3.5 n=1 Tax=Arachis stenosperma TaxID=217475 RepID=UPI0025AC2123|nr:pathogenesis-related thaumatin-like protein 3.5 [Arachis stenosperma]
MANPYTAVLKLTFIFLVIASAPELGGSSKSVTIVNYCKETVWPGITPSENFSGDGFTLKPGQSAVYTAPAGWSGRIWARTGCDFDKNGNGDCQTGGCGGNINCTGPGTPPSTIAEFTLGDGKPDFYDVSLVDGFNLPIAVKAVNGSGNCSTAGCDGDLRNNCPSQLTVKKNDKVIACRSACDVFNTDEYCCRGIYEDPAMCSSSNYSKIFKQVCPVAYSFARDDPTSVMTCTGADFIVTFCGSRNQTVCSYHGKQLLCNGSNSKGFKTKPDWWWVFLLLVAYVSKLCLS